MDKENAKALTVPQLNRWFDITNLRTQFLAINLSNSKPTSRETNNKLFFKKQTGHWPLTKAALDHGIEGRNIVLFYSDKGAATVYIGTCVSKRETGHTKDGKPRYTFTAARQWKGEGHTEVSFSRFFEGFLMSSNPTVLWADMNSHLLLAHGIDAGVRALVLAGGRTCLLEIPSVPQVEFLRRHRETAHNAGHPLVRV